MQELPAYLKVSMEKVVGNCEESKQQNKEEQLKKTLAQRPRVADDTWGDERPTEVPRRRSL